MTNLFGALRSQRSIAPLSLEDWGNFFTFNGIGYPYALNQTLGNNGREDVIGDFEGLVQGAYRANGIVFACVYARQLIVSEARFQFRRLSGGVPGDLFGTDALAALEKPWPNGTTGDLLSRMILDADLGGNSFVVRHEGGLRWLRPDWVTILTGSVDPNAAALDQLDLVGFLYHPDGPMGKRDPEAFLPEQVAHFAPVPDPLFRFRGMSWLVPVLREIQGDSAMNEHKLRYFENGATPNLVVSLDPAIDEDTFNMWIEAFNAEHEGALNAYKTMYLGGGAKAEVVGSDLKQIDFSATQSQAENRICVASRVPPMLLGISKGLEASTYSNYGMARRAFADLVLRPIWRNLAGALSNIVQVPPGAELWYDARDVSFLQEDLTDLAKIQQLQAATINTLVTAGFDPQSAVDAVMTNDFHNLDHSGLVSVQLNPPGEGPQNGATPMIDAPAKEPQP